MKTLLLTIAFAAAALAADVTGNWKGQTVGRDGNTRDISFTFKQDGEKLSGNMVTPMGERPISDGSVKGDDVAFKMVMEFNGNSMTINYTGKVVDGEIKMKSQRDGAPRAQEFSLKKQ